jgi:hypothetical protein
MEKEFQALKILLEFDNEMDIDEKKSNEASKNQENEKSRNINNIKMFIQKNENEITAHKIPEILKLLRERKCRVLNSSNARKG